jgi:hypothetical protein
VTLQVLGAVLLVCLGLLLGATWTNQAFQHKYRQLADERRRLNEQWLAVRAARRQRAECVRCLGPLTDRGWYFEQTLVENPPDDD